MKKYNLVVLSCLLILSIFSFTSCSDGDEDPAISTIVGTWNYNAIDLNIRVNNKPFTTFLIENEGFTAAEAAGAEAFYKALVAESIDFNSAVFLFNADGTYTVTATDYQESGTYRLTNGNSKLILKSAQDEMEYDVEELTNNRLKLSFTETGQEDISNDGINENLELDVTLTLVR